MWLKDLRSVESQFAHYINPSYAIEERDNNGNLLCCKYILHKPGNAGRLLSVFLSFLSVNFSNDTLREFGFVFVLLLLCAENCVRISKSPNSVN